MGLLKTGLKAAVAVKTADVIHERVLARQQQHAAAQGQPGAGGCGGAAGAGRADARGPGSGARLARDMGEKLEQLKQLGELRASGVLTDAEFEAQKARS